jgi:hypothetical protein
MNKLGALPLVAILVVAALPTQAIGQAFDGTYQGKRVLTKGDRSANCIRQEDVSVVIKTGTLTFTDSALKNYTIGFDPHPDGSFNQLRVYIGGSVVDIHGRIVGDTLDADVTNSPCEHHWHLEKK